MLSRLKFDISSIVADIYSKIPQEVFESNVTTFVDVQAAGLQFIIPLVEIFRKKGHSDDNIRSRVYAYVENDLYLNYVMFKYKDLPITYKIYDEKINMKFDVVLGNPPYHEKVGPKKTEPLWPKFVQKSFDMCKEGGYVSLIHPSGWRDVKGNFSKTKDLLKSKNIKTLNMNDFNKGSEIFGVGTNFDWYVIENVSEYQGLTEINDINGKNVNVDLSLINYIPSGSFDIYTKLVAKDGEETVDVIYNRSSYGTDKSHMSKVRTEEHIHPCVYTITQKSGVNLMFSNTKDNGHFGLCKLIWSNGLGTYPIIDGNGEYGLTQFSYGIIDSIDNLEKIKKVMESDIFIKLMNNTKFTNNKYHYKIIATFRKDFWKEFLDENNNVIIPKFTYVK